LPPAKASGAAARSAARDSRIRVVTYSADRIYRLHGYAGYQIDVQFAPGEHFLGAGVGDAKGVTLASAANHLFIKPRAAHVATNLTVLTNRRTYLFDYTASPGPPARDDPGVIFALHFDYPLAVARAGAAARRRTRIGSDLRAAERDAPRNYDYWYCGAPSLKPRAAWDDGVETYLVFGPRAELPAVFVRNAGGGESLVNFDMRGAAMVIQRVARRFVLRRGKLTGCIVNRGFTGSGRRLTSGTLSPDVWRLTRRPAPQGAGARSRYAPRGVQP
jgi:type IV secretion system protein VirB9